MNLPLFSLKGDFPRLWRDAKGLSQLGGCGTRPSAIARTGSNILAIRTFPRSDSLAAQAALVPRLRSAPTLSVVEGLAKIDIRSKRPGSFTETKSPYRIQI